ncbi:MAG: HAD family hydrolase [Firmicutes bacterium]|nr:HAD family hydrolase [Bacillota bacterium]
MPYKMIIHNGVKPEKKLHIGDAGSDIIGANRVGIKTCWINRSQKEWKNEIKPTYTIHSLEEILGILAK